MVKAFHKLFWSTALIILVADQLAKYIFLKGFALDLKFLELHFVKNYGSAFGLFQNAGFMLAIIAAAFIAGLLYYYKTFITSSKESFIASLLLAGALGNLTDRLIWGFVIDFIDFHFWPAFNIADSALTIGAIGLILLEWKK